MDISFERVWQRANPKQIKDAKAFWEAHGLLPTDPHDWRVKGLVALARLDGAVVGVATARLEYQPPLRGRFAMYRCAIAPDLHGHDVVYRMAGYARQVLEEWSHEHPNEQVLGMAAVLDARQYREKQHQPLWPEHGLHLNLAGYSDRGEQIRIAWFDHARVEMGA
jgi:hypothetical protein